MSDFIVCDTGPLISLEKIKDGYNFIRKLYKKILLPYKVLEEVSQSVFSIPQEYINAYNIQDLIEVRNPSKSMQLSNIEQLHIAEAQAIALALELDCPLLIEETIGRDIAFSIGLKISGIAGQVIKAYKQKIIDKYEASMKLRELFEGGRINQKIYHFLINSL
ncbi:hypothetical protein MCHI_000161 [Candidatus Magnetoovum chiemensis]|nr:hypothetical protein MCHI_000161 [Candidatus Magnetoovum chiemensis]